MAYALFIEDSDMAVMESMMQDNRLTGRQRQDGRVFWNGGLSGWRTAPRWPVEYPGYDASVGRIIVLSGSSVGDFRTYLYRLASESPAVADYLRKLADGMADRWGAVEPWPFTAGLDPWAGYIRQPTPPPTTTTTPRPAPVTSTTPIP